MELTYTNVNGYLIPNLTYKSGEQMEQLGKYGFLRRDYLKNYRNSTYQVMLLQDTIGEHLLEVDKAAREREEVILKQLEEKEPLPDKEKDQIAWVRAANQHKAIAEEIMAQIFRVERTKNFTVMSNHHFKNKNLTLKAKGLLSLMLSLPDDWNYNMQGLATLSRDGIDSVRSAIKELEHHGYVERHRLRNEYGFYGDTEYIIREVPLGEEND